MKDGVSASTERLHRLHGTSLIFCCSRLLKLSASTYATACTIFHRFFHQVSLKQASVWSIAMGSTLLAAKTEEAQLPIRSIILVFTHLYRRHRLIITNDEECKTIVKHAGAAVDPLSQTLTVEAKELHLKSDLTGLSSLGPIWKDWYDEIIRAENAILRQLGFTLHWIQDQHPHKFILYFLRVLQVEDNLSKTDYAKFAQRAWNYCNDCYRLDLCIRFDSEVLACTVIYLTALDCNVVLPDDWWQVLCGKGKEAQISTGANAVLGLLESNGSTAAASMAFLTSLVPGGSFNDPDSFLWESTVVADP
jgi:hypothetical protein